VQEAIEENLGAEDAKEWNWKALADQVNKRWGLKTTDRQLRQIGKDELGQYLIEEAEKAVAAVDLSGGETFLDGTWGLRSLCDWSRAKFNLKLEPAGLKDKGPEELRDLLHGQVMALYRQKEVEFPVKVGMARFMAERSHGPGGQRYDREGLYHWARQRFAAAADLLKERRSAPSRAPGCTSSSWRPAAGPTRRWGRRRSTSRSRRRSAAPGCRRRTTRASWSSGRGATSAWRCRRRR
jgi:preprotein translocase subunit SecA